MLQKTILSACNQSLGGSHTLSLHSPASEAALREQRDGEGLMQEDTLDLRQGGSGTVQGAATGSAPTGLMQPHRPFLKKISDDKGEGEVKGETPK